MYDPPATMTRARVSRRRSARGAHRGQRRALSASHSNRDRRHPRRDLCVDQRDRRGGDGRRLARKHDHDQGYASRLLEVSGVRRGGRLVSRNRVQSCDHCGKDGCGRLHARAHGAAARVCVSVVPLRAARRSRRGRITRMTRRRVTVRPTSCATKPRRSPGDPGTGCCLTDDEVEGLASGVCPRAISIKAYQMLEWKRAKRRVRRLAPSPKGLYRMVNLDALTALVVKWREEARWTSCWPTDRRPRASQPDAGSAERRRSPGK